MNYKRYITIFVMFVLLAGGVWMLSQPGEIAPESLARLQALSPASNSAVGQGQGDGEVVDVPTEVIVHEPVPGSAIALSELPLEEDNGDSLYQRWLNGEIDLDEVENFLTPEQEAVLRETLADKGPSENIQSPTNALESIMLEVSFPGPDILDCCASTNQATVPPDPELAAGPNHLIAVVNIAFEIYNKQGQILKQNTTFSSFFSGIDDCDSLGDLFDPNVLYDESTNRFFLGIASSQGFYCAAVSATSNPLGTWNRYKFKTDNSGGFFDYPHAGIGRDAIYMGGNIFNCSTCPYRESRVWAFDKSAMYANAPAAVVERAVPGGTNSDTPQPANLHGFAQGTWPTGGPHYFIVDTNFNGSTYTVYAWNAPFGANNFSPTGTFNMTAATGVAPIFPFTTARQLGSGNRLQTNDWRPQDNEYRNGFLWTTNTITCNPGSGVVTCVRWAQINPVNGSIVQAGVVGSNNEFRFFADVAANHCNDMAMGYTKSSSNIFPGVFVSGREGTDPLNTMQGETVLKPGEKAYSSFDPNPFRWGDYTGFTSDPNGRDFWYLGQYSKNVSHPVTNWGTFVGCYAAVSCEVPNGAQGQTIAKTTQAPPILPEGFDQFSFMPFFSHDPYVPPPILPCGF